MKRPSAIFGRRTSEKRKKEKPDLTVGFKLNLLFPLPHRKLTEDQASYHMKGDGSIEIGVKNYLNFCSNAGNLGPRTEKNRRYLPTDLFGNLAQDFGHEVNLELSFSHRGKTKNNLRGPKNADPQRFVFHEKPSFLFSLQPPSFAPRQIRRL